MMVMMIGPMQTPIFISDESIKQSVNQPRKIKYRQQHVVDSGTDFDPVATYYMYIVRALFLNV